MKTLVSGRILNLEIRTYCRKRFWDVLEFHGRYFDKYSSIQKFLVSLSSTSIEKVRCISGTVVVRKREEYVTFT